MAIYNRDVPNWDSIPQTLGFSRLQNDPANMRSRATLYDALELVEDYFRV